MSDSRKPVERGDVVRVVLNDVTLYYRARRSVPALENLTLRDLQPDPVSDANGMMARIFGDEP